MSDKLQQAVERLRRAKNGESIEIVYGTTNYWSAFARLGNDEAILSNAYLAEHPADDGEPINSEWLESIGSVKVLSDRWHGFYNGDGIEVSFFRPNETVPYKLTIDHQVTVEVKTRGDFRRLCKVFEIDLKEAPRH